MFEQNLEGEKIGTGRMGKKLQWIVSVGSIHMCRAHRPLQTVDRKTNIVIQYPRTSP